MSDEPSTGSLGGGQASGRTSQSRGGASAEAARLQEACNAVYASRAGASPHVVREALLEACEERGIHGELEQMTQRAFLDKASALIAFGQRPVVRLMS